MNEDRCLLLYDVGILSAAALRIHFSSYGEVDKVFLPVSSPGFGVVWFKSERSVEAAYESGLRTVHGFRIHCVGGEFDIKVKLPDESGHDKEGMTGDQVRFTEFSLGRKRRNK